MRQEVLVPELGDTVGEVDVVEITLKIGDQADAEATLLTLETDKAAMDVPLPQAGTLKELKVKVGDKVSSGDVLAVIETTEPVTEAETSPPPESSTPESSTPAPEAQIETPPEPAAASSTEANSGTSREYTVTCPNLGDDVGETVIAELAVSVGSMVAAEASLLTLESDKAAMDLPAPVAGRVLSLAVKVGDSLAAGDLVAVIETTEVMPAAAPEPTPNKTQAEPSKAGPTATPVETPASTAAARAEPAPSIPIRTQGAPLPLASPGVRRFARELGCDISQVKGSGNKGRVLKDDVQTFIKSHLESGTGGGTSELSRLPVEDFSRWGAIETVPLSRIRQLTGANLSRSWPRLPQVTQHDEADITDLEALRQSRKAAAKAEGTNLTPLALIIPALVKALKDFPDFNSSLAEDGKSLIRKQYWHIGIAVDTEAGLVVPVIKNADQKGVMALAAELADLSSRARARKLKPDEMQGASMTISSLGGIGGTGFTPIVNGPQVAILGISRSAMKPVWNGTEFQPRLLLPLSISYDHRVIDGAAAARFGQHLAALLGDLRLTLF